MARVHARVPARVWGPPAGSGPGHSVLELEEPSGRWITKGWVAIGPRGVHPAAHEKAHFRAHTFLVASGAAGCRSHF